MKNNKNYKLKTISIQKLVEDNDLLNDEDLESYHKTTWNNSKANDFHIDEEKLSSMKPSEIPIATEREDGKIKITDGRHRIRALYNDGYKYIKIPVNKENGD